MKNLLNRLPVKIRIIILLAVGLDVLSLIFLRQSYAIYKEKYEFLANFWFWLDHLVAVAGLVSVFPFFKLKDWARRTLIGTSCYSVFSSLRFLAYTVIGTASFTTREAFVNVVSGFVAFLIMVTIPTLLIYFLQSAQILRIFGRNKSEPRSFLLFDQPLPKGPYGLRIRRLIAGTIDLILYPLIFGILIGISSLSVEIFFRNQALFWTNAIGNALIWRDYIFSPGRHFLGLRLVTVSNEAPW